MDSWIETAIGKMHMNKITQRDLARKLIGRKNMRMEKM